jgi:hypothetical protein
MARITKAFHVAEISRRKGSATGAANGWRGVSARCLATPAALGAGVRASTPGSECGLPSERRPVAIGDTVQEMRPWRAGDVALRPMAFACTLPQAGA